MATGPAYRRADCVSDDERHPIPTQSLHLSGDAKAPASRNRIGGAPQVGLEPTTLRLTAIRFRSTPATTHCYKCLLSLDFSKMCVQTITICTRQIMTDFLRNGGHKTGDTGRQRFGSSTTTQDSFEKLWPTVQQRPCAMIFGFAQWLCSWPLFRLSHLAALFSPSVPGDALNYG